MQNYNISIDNFFKSKAHKYVFALLCTSLELRRKLLNIDIAYYYNKNLATNWKNHIEVKLEESLADRDLAPLIKKAMEELYILYNGMIGD